MEEHDQNNLDISQNIVTDPEFESKTEGHQTKMNLFSILFSFKGRINRSDFWIKGTIPLFLFIIIIGSIISFLGQNSIANSLSSILVLVDLWVILALLSKRLHDINKSSWGLLSLPILLLLMALSTMLLYLPGQLNIFAAILYLTCLGFLSWNLSKIIFTKGDNIANKYGETTISKQLPKLQLHPNQITLLSFAIPVIYLIKFSIQHVILNANAGYAGKSIFVVKDGVLETTAGTWNWRFFQCGTILGDMTTAWSLTFEDHGISREIAKALDPTNPTPFVVFCLLCLIPLAVLNNQQKL